MLDVRVTWLRTFMFTDNVSHLTNCLRFRIKKILLNEGSYNLNLFCETNHGLADWVQNVAKLNIVFHDFYKNGRVIPEKQGDLITEYEIL